MKNFINKRDSGKWKGESKGGFKGGKKFGGGGSLNRRGDRDERPQMHSAICDKCNKECEVPFRPTGSKPIFCRDCFRKEEGGSSGPRFDRPDHRSEKPAYRSTPRAGGDEVAKQLKELNAKMDIILHALRSEEDEE